MLLLKDALVKDIQNKEILSGILKQLQIKEFLDPQGLVFLQELQFSASNLELVAKP